MDSEMRRRGEELVLDELFDLRLYERLRDVSRGELAALLEELVAVEAKHYGFWQSLIAIERPRLDVGRRIKLAVLTAVCRLGGPTAVRLSLEGIEIFGIRKYLTLWDKYQGTPFGDAIKEVLTDEFEHEDEIVSGLAARKINPERVRGIFLGFNDGLVEILGAVTGFYAAFRDTRLVAAAGVAVAAAGAISMAAGAYAATSSEREIERVQNGKELFLGRADRPADGEAPFRSSVLVGISYLLGALLPIFPVLLGAGTPLWSIVGGGVAATGVSTILAFLSGMEVLKRVALNLSIVAGAVTISYLIGALAHRLWGLSIL